MAVLACLLLIALQSCGRLLTKSQSRQEIPIDRYYSISELRSDSEKSMFVTLQNFSGDLLYENMKIEPDSIVCYIDSFLTTPTLIISKVYIEKTEYRFHNRFTQRRGVYPPDNDRSDERFATINYRIPILVFRFSFPSLDNYESLIPQKIRENAHVRYAPPPQLNFE